MAESARVESGNLRGHEHWSDQSGFSLVNQIRRAAASIMSNIAEGFERGGQAEFHQFLVISKGSCGEVRSNLYIALDVGYLNEKESKRLGEMAENTGKIIGALRAAVQKRRDSRK